MEENTNKIPFGRPESGSGNQPHNQMLDIQIRQGLGSPQSQISPLYARTDLLSPNSNFQQQNLTLAMPSTQSGAVPTLGNVNLQPSQTGNLMHPSSGVTPSFSNIPTPAGLGTLGLTQTSNQKVIQTMQYNQNIGTSQLQLSPNQMSCQPRYAAGSAVQNVGYHGNQIYGYQDNPTTGYLQGLPSSTLQYSTSVQQLEGLVQKAGQSLPSTSKTTFPTGSSMQVATATSGAPQISVPIATPTAGVIQKPLVTSSKPESITGPALTHKVDETIQQGACSITPETNQNVAVPAKATESDITPLQTSRQTLASSDTPQATEKIGDTKTKDVTPTGEHSSSSTVPDYKTDENLTTQNLPVCETNDKGKETESENRESVIQNSVEDSEKFIGSGLQLSPTKLVSKAQSLDLPQGQENISENAEPPMEWKSTDSIPIEYQDEPEFTWEEYLEETGAIAAPPTSFKHVECSLQSGFTKGMKLEVANKCNPTTYWVASVVMTCGPLLRLRYDGYGEDSAADFWSDVFTSDIHPIGWCAQNSKNLQPPEAIKDKYEDWSEFLVKTLTGARTAPNYLLDKTTGITPIDQIKQGMRLEVQHALQSKWIWIVKIMENVGGRLLLRYEGTDSAAHDFWLFYLNPRLHPIDWGQENSCIFRPPEEIKAEHENYQEWSEILQQALKDAREMQLPSDVFKDQIELREHSFKKGWKLEVLNPNNRTKMYPATVVQVISNFYFLVEIDDFSKGENDTGTRLCCHSDSPDIFPARWALWKGVNLVTPKGYSKPEFDWDDYLEYCKAEAAPEKCFNMDVPDHEFKRGMKLEAVNPDHPHQICAATITKIIDQLMWIHLDSATKMIANHIVDVESHDIFPVGWCESNGYPLKPPRKALGRGKPPHKKVAVVQPEKPFHVTPEEFRSETYTQMKEGDAGSSWCPKIYFNHRCFSGPYLSKGRIAELPKCVGPGPVVLVMKEILSMLINVAYKSSRVLKELQLEGDPNLRMHQQVLKAKYKGKSYRATVEICRNTSQIEEFCRQACIKLECCPNLFSPHYVNDSCPENCSQLTKTKYTHYYGKKKKRKIGRPPGGHTNLENGAKRPGKRRKRRKVNLMPPRRKTLSTENGDAYENGDDVFEGDDDKVSTISKESSESRHSSSHHHRHSHKDNDPDFRPLRGPKRKYTHFVAPPSDIRTRGAKLPKYTFERRTHKKVLVSERAEKERRLSKQEKEAKKHHRKHKDRDISPPKEKPYYSIKPSERLYLDSNPLTWTVEEVIAFIKTTDCASLARQIKEQEIDGQALLLLNLPTIQEYMELKLGPAIKLCHHVERVKLAFFTQYT